MSEFISPKNAFDLINTLNQGRYGHEKVNGRDLPNDVRLLRTWQSVRLARTQTDLLATKRYATACRFFLSDIYAPKDFSQRDEDIERIYHFMSKFIPAKALKPLKMTLTLYDFTNQLDTALLQALKESLGMTDTLTTELYAAAYRHCDNYAARKQQIADITHLGQKIDRMVHLPLIGTTLRLARRPALSAGWVELQDFLERGFKAFKKMHGADEFLRIVEERETEILDKIFDRDPDPFGFGQSLVLSQAQIDEAASRLKG